MRREYQHGTGPGAMAARVHAVRLVPPFPGIAVELDAGDGAGIRHAGELGGAAKIIW